MSRRSSKRSKSDQAATAARESVSTKRFLSHRAEFLILAILVTAAVVVTHWPVLEARALTLDDQMYLTNNPLVQRPSGASASRFLTEVLQPSTVQGYYQPLAMISLMLDYAVAGSVDNLKTFHATSLILHLANTLLIMFLLYALFGRPWIAAAVALLFGVHPMTVEPIAWVGERKTMLATFFALCSLLSYIRYAKKGGSRHYLACLGLFVLALMSKPTTTPIPIVLLLLDFWPLNRLSWRSVVEKIPFFVVGGVFAVITIVSQATAANVHMPSEHTSAQPILAVCHSIVFYLVKVIWPINLTSQYPIPDPFTLSNPTVLLSLIGTCVLLAGLVWSLRKTRALLTGWLIFILAIFPTLGVIGFTSVLTSDKYAYLPAIGYLLVLAWLFDNLASKRANEKPTRREATLGAGVLMVALMLAIGTRDYLQEWQTTKWHNFYMLKLAPNSPKVLVDCANSFTNEGDYAQAISHYNKAIDQDPRHADAYYNRGHAFEKLGNDAQAVKDYTKVIELAPRDTRFARAYNNRSTIYNRLGDYTRAVQDCSRAIELDAYYAEAYTNRGIAYKNMGDFTQAIRDYSRAIEIRPDLAETYNNRGNVYLDMREFDQAIRDYTRAIELKLDFPEAYNNRGNCYNELKNFGQAFQDYAKAIKLRPTYAEAYLNRANAYMDMEDLNQAISEYSKAIELNPGYGNAYHNRAVAYYKLRQFDQAWEDLQKCQKAGGRPKPEVVQAFSEAAGRTQSTPR